MGQQESSPAHTPAATAAPDAATVDTAAATAPDTAAATAAAFKAQWQCVRLVFAKRLNYYCPQTKDTLRAMLWQPLVVVTAASTVAAGHSGVAAASDVPSLPCAGASNAAAAAAAGAGGSKPTAIDISKPFFLTVETLAGIVVARLQADPNETVESFKRRLAEAVEPKLDSRTLRLFRCVPVTSVVNGG
jgi:hypothetical protein